MSHYVAFYVGPIQIEFLRGFQKSYGGTGIVIPVKKVHRNGKHRNPEDSCRNYQPRGSSLVTSPKGHSGVSKLPQLCLFDRGWLLVLVSRIVLELDVGLLVNLSLEN